MNPSPEPQFIGPRSEATFKFGGLRFEEMSYDVGLRLPKHAHKEAFLELCLAGTTEEFWGRQAFVRGPSTLNYFPIGAPHATHFQQNVRTFQIVINATWLERVRQVAPVVDTLTYYPKGSPIWTAARLYREFQCRDELSPLVLEGMLLELLAEMSRNATALAGHSCPRWLKQARDFLHAYFTESVSVEAVATAVGVHPSHLMRGFRQYFRCTVGDYVRRLRVEHACQLLSTSDAPPSQIALAVGFADQSHFSRTFKSCLGVTPTEFRKVCGRASFRQELIV
jgi:AraC family transcriptional regulator